MRRQQSEQSLEFRVVIRVFAFARFTICMDLQCKTHSSGRKKIWSKFLNLPSLDVGGGGFQLF